MTPRYPLKNSTQVCWVDTHRVTLAEYEADISYNAEDLRQGRDATNSVPRVSMYAGKPIEDPKLNKAALLFWGVYWAIFGLSLCAALLAVWPK